MGCVTAEDIKDILAALMLKAKSGDAAAARLVLAYTVGRPAETVDPDRLNTESQELIRPRQATPCAPRCNKSELDECLTEPASVWFAGIDEQVEILRVSFVSVKGDGEAAHHHEPDAMVLQQT